MQKPCESISFAQVMCHLCHCEGAQRPKQSRAEMESRLLRRNDMVSLVPERLDRSQPRRAPGGIDAANRAEDKCKHKDLDEQL